MLYLLTLPTQRGLLSLTFGNNPSLWRSLSVPKGYEGSSGETVWSHRGRRSLGLGAAPATEAMGSMKGDWVGAWRPQPSKTVVLAPRRYESIWYSGHRGCCFGIWATHWRQFPYIHLIGENQLIARGSRRGEIDDFVICAWLCARDSAHHWFWPGVHCQAAVLDTIEGARDKTDQGNLWLQTASMWLPWCGRWVGLQWRMSVS